MQLIVCSILKWNIRTYIIFSNESLSKIKPVYPCQKLALSQKSTKLNLSKERHTRLITVAVTFLNNNIFVLESQHVLPDLSHSHLHYLIGALQTPSPPIRRVLTKTSPPIRINLRIRNVCCQPAHWWANQRLLPWKRSSCHNNFYRHLGCYGFAMSLDD